MEPIELKRDRKPILKFTGEHLAGGTTRGNDTTRWVTVVIYRTAKGKLIAHVARTTQWAGERDTDDAEAFDTAKQMVDWLRESNGGEIGQASQEALESLIKHHPEYTDCWVEEVA